MLIDLKIDKVVETQQSPPKYSSKFLGNLLKIIKNIYTIAGNL